MSNRSPNALSLLIVLWIQQARGNPPPKLLFCKAKESIPPEQRWKSAPASQVQCVKIHYWKKESSGGIRLWSTTLRAGCFYIGIYHKVQSRVITLRHFYIFHVCTSSRKPLRSRQKTRSAFLLSIKWRPHQLLQPPLITLPPVLSSAAAAAEDW